MLEPARGTTAKSWPPVVAMGSALVLIFLVFPNPLRVPNNDPTASAEYAPVPGRQESAENANFGETGLASSGGIGAGGEGFGFLSGSPPGKPPPQFRPRQLDCVGSPPRQTEDELSPPCVAFFDGDNGDETWEGVTRDEILIVYYNDFGVEGDMTTPYRASDENGLQTDYYYANHTRTVKAQLRYFSKRFQTYGRRVRMIAVPSGGGLATRPNQRQGEAIIVANQYKPFAVTILIENAQDFAPLMADYEVPSFGWNEDVPLGEYRKSAPYFWSFMPDQATETKWSASFICRKLWANKDGDNGEGRARFTTDPTLEGRQRKFGLIYQGGQERRRGPFLEQLALQLQAELREQCGLEVKMQPYVGNGNAATTMQQFKGEGITTVICYCTPQQTELHVPALQNAATSLNYFPEWFWDHASAMDRALWQRNYGSPEHQGFGTSFLWRQNAFKQSYAYKAYLSEEPNSIPNLRFNFEIYHVFLNVFSGIQAAGPKLTPETIKKGMFTFGYQNPDYAYVPTGGYGDFGPSPYTFVHTAMGWWWDPTGTPPGGRAGEGCIRVMYDGKRYYGGNPASGRQWPFGDQDIKQGPDGDWPCTEDERREFSTN